MNVIGLLRVKNEKRWIARAVNSIMPLCKKVLVLDDHSDDGTPFLCAGIPGVQVHDSPFAGVDETRDKNWLLDKVRHEAEWVVWIDGDEMLAPAAVPLLSQAMQNGAQSISMRIPFLWDAEDRIRVDGVYGEFRRHSAFRPRDHRFTSDEASGFHCGNVPYNARRVGAVTIPAHLLHFGYLHAEDRARKYCWYNAHDPANRIEDRYRHVAAGLAVPHEDLIALQRVYRKTAGKPELTEAQLLPPAPGATEKTAHAGPMEFARV